MQQSKVPGQSVVPSVPAQQPQITGFNRPSAQVHDLGKAVPAIKDAFIGAGATALTGATVTKWLGTSAPLWMSNPYTAALAITLGAGLAASPYIYNKIKQWSTNNKIASYEKKQ